MRVRYVYGACTAVSYTHLDVYKRQIIADGPRVTLVALSGVVLLIVLLFGVRNAVPILLALAIGLTWLAGLVLSLIHI